MYYREQSKVQLSILIKSSSPINQKRADRQISIMPGPIYATFNNHIFLLWFEHDITMYSSVVTPLMFPEVKCSNFVSSALSSSHRLLPNPRAARYIWPHFARRPTHHKHTFNTFSTGYSSLNLHLSVVFETEHDVQPILQFDV